MASTAKRGRIEILADILEVIKRQNNSRLIRISYGSNLPLDRAKKLLASLASAGLVAIKRDDSITTYQITQRGLEFLEVHRRMLGFLEALEDD